MALIKSLRLFAFAVLSMFVGPGLADSRSTYPLEFEIRISEEAVSRIADLGLEVPITGRAFVIITRDADSEPREQTGVRGVPLWGKDVRGLRGGDRFSF
ncbi:MAG: hypothetical protein AAGL66_16870, partial [Pseudomonadota bacterium]